MSAIGLPVPRAPMVDQSGAVSREWYGFFRSLVQAVGGDTRTVSDISADTMTANYDVTSLEDAFRKSSDGLENSGLPSRIALLEAIVLSNPDTPGALGRLANLESRLDELALIANPGRIETGTIAPQNADNVKITGGAINGTIIGATTPAAITGTTITGTGAVTGSNLTHITAQQVSTETGAVATGSTVIPGDDTIPQNTEGDQYLSLSITPTATTSVLVIEIAVNVASSTGAVVIGALFQDATANALAAAWQRIDTAGQPVCLSFRHMMVAGTTSATTFKVRLGTNAVATLTLNGSGGSRFLGGVLASSLRITEYLA